MLWHCWLGDRKDIRPVKRSCWYADVGDATVTNENDFQHLTESPQTPLAAVESRMLRHSGTCLPRLSRSRGSVVKATDLHPTSLGLTSTGTHMCQWWRQKGHLANKSPTILAGMSEPVNKAVKNVKFGCSCLPALSWNTNHVM